MTRATVLKQFWWKTSINWSTVFKRLVASSYIVLYIPSIRFTWMFNNVISIRIPFFCSSSTMTSIFETNTLLYVHRFYTTNIVRPFLILQYSLTYSILIPVRYCLVIVRDHPFIVDDLINLPHFLGEDFLILFITCNFERHVYRYFGFDIVFGACLNEGWVFSMQRDLRWCHVFSSRSFLDLSRMRNS